MHFVKKDDLSGNFLITFFFNCQVFVSASNIPYRVGLYLGPNYNFGGPVLLLQISGLFVSMSNAWVDPSGLLSLLIYIYIIMRFLFENEFLKVRVGFLFGNRISDLWRPLLRSLMQVCRWQSNIHKRNLARLYILNRRRVKPEKVKQQSSDSRQDGFNLSVTVGVLFFPPLKDGRG